MSIAFISPQYLWLLLLIPLTVVIGLHGRGVRQVRRWAGLVLRCLLLLLLVLALAGIQIRLPSNLLTAVFVLDASDSISPEEVARAEDLIRQAIQEMPSNDRAAVVVFGEDALVERLASPEGRLAEVTSTPITTRTNIASALQLAMALFPDEGARRLVLLSDGRENLSNALEQAELAALQEIELQYVPLNAENEPTEVLLSGLDAPADARQGQEFDLTAVIESSASIGATLRIFADGSLIETRELNLQSGVNRVAIPIQNLEPGFHRFRAQIAPDVDNRLQNNEASAFTIVHGPPSILMVEGTPGEGQNLSAALQSAQMDVTVIDPANIPATLAELARYDMIVLANVPASALPAGTMQALPVYIRELGKGLLMTGGDSAFGAGGYLRTPLEEAMPVYMDVKSRELAANLALIVAVDKSGSMGRCHCDDPDLNQTYDAIETGQPKVDIAKEAIMRAASALGEDDFLGVVAFDEQAHWLLDPQPLPDSLALENAIGSFQASGQTNLFNGVTQAYDAVQDVNAKRKHIVLMTDGWVHTGELTDLAAQMQAEGITLSVIAAGEGSAEYLEALADSGGGRYYPATDILRVPDIFLKETIQSVGQYIIEEPFRPLPDAISPALRGIDLSALPPLLGYNGTSIKNAARMDMLTPRGDPLLASWQYGLGRSAAWTSDVKGQWASEWVQWQDFNRFAAQLTGWLLPVPQAEGFDGQIEITEEGVQITLSALDEDNQPWNDLEITGKLIDPELQTGEFPLEQIGAGQYRATVRADQPGTYLVWLGAYQGDLPAGQMTLGLVVPYSPEYRSGGTQMGLLEALARLTGGGELSEPAEAFLHNLPAQSSAREIWRALLILAALLFPLDVAVRRLNLSRRDLQLAANWVSERLPNRRRGSGTEPQVFGELFSARERARRRNQAPRPAAKPPASEQPADPTAAEPPPAASPEVGPPDPQDSLARLREAKKRARK